MATTVWLDDQTGSRDLLVVKYGPAGNQLWVTEYERPVDLDALAHRIAVGPSDSVYVGARLVDSAFYARDFLTIKYTQTMNPAWAAATGRADGSAQTGAGRSLPLILALPLLCLPLIALWARKARAG